MSISHPPHRILVIPSMSFETEDSDACSYGYCSLSDSEPDESCNESDDFYFPQYLQYFLAAVCDLRLSEDNDFRLGLRHPHSIEVTRLLRKLEKRKLSTEDLQRTHPNAIVTVVQELLNCLPPLFESEEFLCLSVDCSNSLALCYLNGLIGDLSPNSRQLAFLCSRSIARLVQLAGATTHALTDAVMIFTPIFFPRCTSRSTSFLRASRATLLLLENNEHLFQQYIELDRFYTEIFGSLNRLHESILTDSEDESADCQSTTDSERDEEIVLPEMTSSQGYYTITFEESEDEL